MTLIDSFSIGISVCFTSDAIRFLIFLPLPIRPAIWFFGHLCDILRLGIVIRRFICALERFLAHESSTPVIHFLQKIRFHGAVRITFRDERSLHDGESSVIRTIEAKNELCSLPRHLQQNMSGRIVAKAQVREWVIDGRVKSDRLVVAYGV